MAQKRGALCCALLVLLTGSAVFSQDYDFEDQSKPAPPNGGLHPNAQQIEKLCKGRPEGEYFRLLTGGDCRDVVRCDQAGLTGAIRLAGVKCPNGLAFDIFKQTCDWKGRVRNCDVLESKSYFSLRNVLFLAFCGRVVCSGEKKYVCSFCLQSCNIDSIFQTGI